MRIRCLPSAGWRALRDGRAKNNENNEKDSVDYPVVRSRDIGDDPLAGRNRKSPRTPISSSPIIRRP